MSKKLPEWMVVKLKARGERVGTFQAPDAKMAIKRAVKECELDEETQKRLAAYRVS